MKLTALKFQKFQTSTVHQLGTHATLEISGTFSYDEPAYLVMQNNSINRFKQYYFNGIFWLVEVRELNHLGT